MGDNVLSCTEEELIAQAVALSLAQQTTNERCESGNTESTTSTEMSSSRPGVAGKQPSSDSPRTQSPPGPPMRYGTSQSNDSALAEQDDSFMGYQRDVSLLNAGSPPSGTQRSSPDLGIATEVDIDPLSGTVGSLQRREGDGKASNTSPSSSPEADQNASIKRTANITLDGRETNDRAGKKSPKESYLLPLASLSSFHEGLDATAKVWTPNKEALELIIGMGISENAAKRALYHTGNENAEHAVGWVFENINLPDLHEHFEPPVTLSTNDPVSCGFEGSDIYLSFDEFSQSREDSFKMILVVNTELKMGVGKIAAQVGHAVLGLYRRLQKEKERRTELAEWEQNGAKKIVLKGKDALHLMELKRKAATISTLTCLVVQDAGRTQIDPGSLTVLGLFGTCNHVDAITGHLKLL